VGERDSLGEEAVPSSCGQDGSSRRLTSGYGLRPRGTVARPLDGGALTLRWVRTPARGPTVAPSPFPPVVSGRRAAMAAARVVMLREKGRGKGQEKE
jgi:hypothetical protein